MAAPCLWILVPVCVSAFGCVLAHVYVRMCQWVVLVHADVRVFRVNDMSCDGRTVPVCALVAVSVSASGC